MLKIEFCLYNFSLEYFGNGPNDQIDINQVDKQRYFNYTTYVKVYLVPNMPEIICEFIFYSGSSFMKASATSHFLVPLYDICLMTGTAASSGGGPYFG